MKLKKVLCVIGVMCAILFTLVGCSGNNNCKEIANDGSKKQERSEVLNNKIKIDNISWNVYEGVVDSDRYVLLEYTNNSAYSIVSFELTFKEKSEIKQEEKEKFYEDLQKKVSLSDNDLNILKDKVISMHITSDRIVNPGESIKNVNCYYYGGSHRLNNLEHYNLVEPDIATIKYIDGEQIYTIYYDFSSNNYSMEEETEVAYQWSATDLGSKIPKPNVKVVESSRDDDMIFMFDAYGLTLEQFDAYVEECKTLGYTIDGKNHEGFYSADNVEGYNVYLNYDEDNYSMSGTVKSSGE